MESNLKKFESFKRGLSWSAIKKALQSGGCPICNIVEKSTEKYIEFLLRECPSDAEVHKRNLKSMGFCKRHSNQLKEIESSAGSDGLNIAAIYETVISREIKNFERVEDLLNSDSQNILKVKSSLKWKKRKIIESLSTSDECFICKNEAKTALFYVHEIIKIAADEEFREVFSGSDALFCRNHFILLISEIKDENNLKYFVDSHSKKILQIQNNLRSFIKKHNYQNTEELTEEEKSAVEILLNYFGS